MEFSFLREVFSAAFAVYLFLHGVVSEAENLGKTLNSGLAFAELVVVAPAQMANVPWDRTKVYVLPRTPPTIKPVAGVLTVESGSLISHVQLLCRSLGIPNGMISSAEYQALSRLHGQKILYLALDSNPLLVFPEKELTQTQRDWIAQYQGEFPVPSITLPAIDLKENRLLSLDQVGRDASGKVCGPKAANLGFLKNLFPDRVADGFVIPFAVVRQIFDASGIGELIIALNQLTGDAAKAQLQRIRGAIERVALPEELVQLIREKTRALLETNRGAGVFVRSDTNVEDLPQFSGAGLNKTVPNVLRVDAVLDSIRQVWASPWTERSYEWRHRVVTNPELILPSVLVMQSVDAKRAGVFANLNFTTGSTDDFLVSANEGLGFKVVDGLETAEEWLIRGIFAAQPIEKRAEFINSAYARTQFVLDNVNGGIREVPTTTQDILELPHLGQLEEIIKTVRMHTDFPVPFEGEFGVTADGIVRLFQIRPIVEGGSQHTKAILRKFYEQL